MKKAAKNIHTLQKFQFKKINKWRLLGLLSTILLFIYIALIKRVFLTPDIIFIFFFISFIFLAQAREFLKRFVPIISLLVVYEFFRGLADWLNGTVNYTPMITFDRWLTGGALPTVWLQEILWNGSVVWYDFYFYFLYMLHFIAPLGFALILWKTRSIYYWKFVLGLITLSFAAFITYLLYPAAPPWMAKELSIIPEDLVRISSHVWYAFGVESFSEFYGKLPANPVAAVPSLHSAYPLLISLFAVKAYGSRKTAWLFIYPISIWIGVVYLGEHYVVDVILGALYAYAAYRLAVSPKIYAFLKDKILNINRLLRKQLKKS